MMAIFLVLSIAVIILLLLCFVFYRKKEFQKESPKESQKKFIEKFSKYICDECGEKDCICHRVDDIK